MSGINELPAYIIKPDLYINEKNRINPQRMNEFLFSVFYYPNKTFMMMNWN